MGWVRRRCGLAELTGIAALVAVLGARSACAETYRVRLRWEPSPSPGVVGYRVYMRQLDGSFGAPLDVGMPPLGPDGMLSFMIGGLDTNAAYALAVSAYLPDGTESGLSNELGPTACQFLSVSRFKLKLGGRRGRLIGRASFGSSGAIEPDLTGASVEITSEDGTPLYAAALPPGAFRTDRRRRIFRYVRRRGRKLAPHTNGVKRLLLRSDGQTVDMVVKATTSEPERLAGGGHLMLWLRLGSQCASVRDLVCVAGEDRRSTCIW